MLDPNAARALKGWSERVEPALWRALIALWVVVLVASPHLARSGTELHRLVAELAILVATVGVVAVVLRQRLRRPSSATFVRRVRGLNGALAERIARAERLRLRVRGTAANTSSELAEHHLKTLIDRVPLWGIEGAARLRARRLVRISLLTWVISFGLVLLEPLRLLEGYAVLLARTGSFQLPIDYLEITRLSLQHPEYLKKESRELGMVTSLTEPEGSVLVVRGAARHPNRQLMVSDGHREIPLVDDGRGQLVARFPCERSGRIGVVARFGEARLWQRHSIELRVIKDRPPVIELELEGGVLDLTRSEQAVIPYRISDDHGVSKVQLHLRTGLREELRLLSELDGSRATEFGGLLLDRADPFLIASGFPIEVTIRARDNTTLPRGGWGESRSITVLVPRLGERETARLTALTALREKLAQMLAVELEPGPNAFGSRESLKRALATELSVMDSQSALPLGLRQVLTGQLARLLRARNGSSQNTEISQLLLFMDQAIETLGSRDAKLVSLSLATLTDQIRQAARALGSETTDPRSEELMLVALRALEDGAGHLQNLTTLGEDLAQAVRLATARLERARELRDWRAVEAVGTLLTERLQLAAPRFGWRGAVGVEMASGVDDVSLLRLSQLDVRFDRLSREIERLAADHAALIEQNAALTRTVAVTRAPGEWANELSVHAQALTRLTELLDSIAPPNTDGAACSQLNEALRNVRDSLARAELISAATNLDRALALVGTLEANLAPASSSAEVVRKLELSLTVERGWVREKTAALRILGGVRAAESYQTLAEGESELAQRTERLVERERAADAVLPEAFLSSLGQAMRMMRNAQAALLGTLGTEALLAQREAQRLLEQCAVGETFGASDDSKALGLGATPLGTRSNRQPMSTTPTTDPLARERFRRQVQESLGNQAPPSLHDSVTRYVEGLLR